MRFYLVLVALVSGTLSTFSLSMSSAMTDPEDNLANDTLSSAPATSYKPGPLELRAMDYIRFREDISMIESMPFDNESITREAHKKLGGYDAWALSSGWMAYAALIAADTPEFAAALREDILGPEEERNKKKKKKRRKKRKKNEPAPLTERDAFLAKLAADPRYPKTLPGADKAVAAVMATLRDDNLRVRALGENFKSKAYSMQKTRWGKKRLNSGQDRIAEATYYRESRPGISMPTLNVVEENGVSKPGIMSAPGNWSPDWGHEGSRSATMAAGSDVIMDRILHLAARYAVGSLNDKLLTTYAKNKKAEQCLSLSKLKLDGCIAATRSPYEEAFCLGEHAINDIAKCVGWMGNY